MRKKRNTPNEKVSTKGYIETYFGTDIGRILVPNLRSLQNIEVPYVPHLEAEEILKNCMTEDFLFDKSLVFTGLTGSGKTTILRHVFGLENNASNPRFEGQIVIIPIDFNRSQKSPQDGILSSLRVAIEMICERCGIDYPDVDNEQFYSYIVEQRRDLLKLNSKWRRSTSHKESMETLIDKMPVTFASCQLQYVMDYQSNKFKLVLLVVDNIEAFLDLNAKYSHTRYLTPIIEAFKLADCIAQRRTPTQWRFNMVIACRHHIWRIMKGEFSNNNPENALLQSYVTTEVPYDLADPVKVTEIVQKREEVFSKKQRDLEKWNTAVEVVNTILQSMENNIGNFVLQLELKDLRKSMPKLREIILHKGLQKVPDKQIVDGAFQIGSIEQFDLSRVNIIKVIGLGSHKYYSDQTSIIPNLLVNDQTEGMELFVLLTLNYFLISCNYLEPTWDNSVSISEFYADMEFIFKDQYYSAFYKNFQTSIQILIKHRLLLRSADQSQSEVPGLSLTEIEKIENVYVSGAAIVLWHELGKSSALFQLFLDDIWLDEDTDYFYSDGNDIEHCVKYLGTLYDAEQKIYNAAKNFSSTGATYYLNKFGIVPICKQLITGLIASLDAIIASGDSRSQSRIVTAKRTLEKTKKLAQKIQEWEKIRLGKIST